MFASRDVVTGRKTHTIDRYSIYSSTPFRNVSNASCRPGSKEVHSNGSCVNICTLSVSPLLPAPKRDAPPAAPPGAASIGRESGCAAHVTHQLQLLPAFSDTPDAGALPNKLPPEDLDPLPGKLVPWILRSESVWWSCSAC